MTSRGFRVLLGILAFVLLYLVALALSIPKIENNLTSSVDGAARGRWGDRRRGHLLRP